MFQNGAHAIHPLSERMRKPVRTVQNQCHPKNIVPKQCKTMGEIFY